MGIAFDSRKSREQGFRSSFERRFVVVELREARTWALYSLAMRLSDRATWATSCSRLASRLRLVHYELDVVDDNQPQLVADASLHCFSPTTLARRSAIEMSD
jgi:hypothetical protein